MHYSDFFERVEKTERGYVITVEYCRNGVNYENSEVCHSFSDAQRVIREFRQEFRNQLIENKNKKEVTDETTPAIEQPPAA